MNEMSKMNPLSKYTKIEEIFTKLVSNDKIKYKSGVLAKGIKCGVCARSARDEIMLNNPDALISGESVIKVIENCVPNVLDAGELYINDIEQLLIAIKVATKEDTYDIDVECPECHHKGLIQRDLKYLIETAGSFSEQPSIDLDNGLKIYFKPYTFNEYTEFGNRMFTEQKRSEYVMADTESAEESKIEIFKDIFENMTVLNYDMIVYAIDKIETPDGDIVQDKEFISEWVGTLPKEKLKEIREQVDSVIDVGISHSMNAQCSECHHEWEIDGLRYDPSNFFAPSFSTQNQKM